MGRAYSYSIAEGKSPQYVYALVILSGGIACAISQFGDPLIGWLSYVLLAAFFASVWPEGGWRWGVWLCLPTLLLIVSDFITVGSYAAFRNGPMIIRVLPSAFLGAYLGSKLSVRKIASRLAHRPPHRKRLNGRRKSPRNGLGLKDQTPPQASVRPLTENRTFHTPVLPPTSVAPAKSLHDSLIKATQEGNLERVGRLIAEGADVNAEGSDNWTPVMIAAQGGDVDVIKTLFDNAGKPDASSNKGWTALMIATIEGHVEVVRALLENGAQVNARNNRGWTALRFAVSMNETEILRLLLDAGAEVNGPDDEGRTALMQAAEENLCESLEALLEAGADPHLKDHKEQTALSLARQRQHSSCIKLLKEAEAQAPADASPNMIDNDSYFYLLKEELEEKLNSHPADDVVSHLLSALQEQIEAIKRERSLAPAVLSHKLLLTLREAAALSGLPRQHLLDAIEGGRLKAQLLEHAWRIRRAELDDYIARLR